MGSHRAMSGDPSASDEKIALPSKNTSWQVRSLALYAIACHILRRLLRGILLALGWALFSYSHSSAHDYRSKIYVLYCLSVFVAIDYILIDTSNPPMNTFG